LIGSYRLQQVEWRDTEFVSKALHRLQREIAFPSLHRTEVRSVELQVVGQLLLAQSTGVTNSGKVQPHDALEIALCHPSNSAECYLTGLQTDE
jgi:hypothetical protein